MMTPIPVDQELNEDRRPSDAKAEEQEATTTNPDQTVATQATSQTGASSSVVEQAQAPPLDRRVECYVMWDGIIYRLNPSVVDRGCANYDSVIQAIKTNEFLSFLGDNCHELSFEMYESRTDRFVPLDSDSRVTNGTEIRINRPE